MTVEVGEVADTIGVPPAQIREALNHLADLGEAVAAAVVLEADAGFEAEQLVEALTPLLARFKLPRRIEFVQALPRNAMGKVQKNLLRETYGGKND